MTTHDDQETMPCAAYACANEATHEIAVYSEYEEGRTAHVVILRMCELHTRTLAKAIKRPSFQTFCKLGAHKEKETP